MPIVIEMLRNKNHLFSIQQPEVHLHPKAQSAFGEFIYNSITEFKNRFIIETHSDFTINKFRYNQYLNKNEKLQAQVVFFEMCETGTKLTLLKINNKGQFPENIPDSYSKFFIDEEMKMLEF